MENNTYKRLIRIKDINWLFVLCNLLYFVVAIVLSSFISNFNAQMANVFNNYILNPLILIFAFIIPSLIYSRIKELDYKEVFNLRRLKLKYIFPLITIGISTQFIGIFLNSVSAFVIQQFGSIKSSANVIPQNMTQFILMSISVAASPAIFEELFMRGLIFSQYKKVGIKFTIVGSAILFAIIHFDIKNALFPLFLGIVLGYVVYRTSSVYSSMIIHFVNNMVGVILLYVFKPQETEYIQVIGADVLFQQLIIALIATVFLIVSLYFVIRLSNKYEIKKIENNRFLARDFCPIFISLSIYLLVTFVQFQNLSKI